MRNLVVSVDAHPQKDLQDQAISLATSGYWEIVRFWLNGWFQWGLIFTLPIEVIGSTSTFCLYHLFYRWGIQWNKVGITQHKSCVWASYSLVKPKGLLHIIINNFNFSTNLFCIFHLFFHVQIYFHLSVSLILSFHFLCEVFAWVVARDRQDVYICIETLFKLTIIIRVILSCIYLT